MLMPAGLTSDLSFSRLILRNCSIDSLSTMRSAMHVATGFDRPASVKAEVTRFSATAAHEASETAAAATKADRMMYPGCNNWSSDCPFRAEQRHVPPIGCAMPTSLIEWTVRMVMLVLAGLVTLSILSSLAAISNQPALLGPAGRPGAMQEPAESRPGDTPPPAPAPEQPSAASAPTEEGVAGVEAPAENGTTIATPPADRDPQRWLEAIAYALLALTGLFALFLVVMWRGLRRLALAMEENSTR